jgi:hypothetical protein
MGLESGSLIHQYVNPVLGFPYLNNIFVVIFLVGLGLSIIPFFKQIQFLVYINLSTLKVLDNNTLE